MLAYPFNGIHGVSGTGTNENLQIRDIKSGVWLMGRLTITLVYPNVSMYENKYAEVVQEYSAFEHGNKRVASRAHWHMYMAAISVNICSVGAGCMSGWTSSAENVLVTDKVYPGPIDKDTWSWIASLYPFGAIIGPIPLVLLMDRFGRKPCLMAIGAMYLTSWALIAAATGAVMLIIGRFLAGIAISGLLALMPIYIAEISTDNVRSTLNAMMSLSSNLGYLLAVSVGPHVHPSTLAVISGGAVVVFLVTFAFTPETPYVLVAKGDLDGATNSLVWLRGKLSGGVEKELANIQASQERASAERSAISEKLRSLFCNKGNLKGFGICCGLLVFTELSGRSPVLYFAESIFRASGTSLDPATCATVIGVVLTVASCGTLVLTRFFSTKALMIASAAGMTIGQVILGYFFYQKEAGGDAALPGMVPVGALILYVIFYCVGFSSLPWATVGEVLGSDVKATASFLGNGISNLVAFLLSWKFAVFLEVLTPAWTFWGFGVCCALASIFTLIFVPNTRGKSLLQIQDELCGRAKENKSGDQC